MSYVMGERVRMQSNHKQGGTVTGERDQMFVSFVGVQWDHEDFGFVAPSRLELAGRVHVPGLTPDEHAAIWQALSRASEAITSDDHNPSDTRTEVVDWQARAERAEAKVRSALRRLDSFDSDSYAGFLIEDMRQELGYDRD